MAAILVVDDDRAVLALVCEALERAGNQTHAAMSAEDALALVRRGDFAIQAAVVDVKLPGMDGIALIAELRAMSTGLPCLVITGYPGFPISVEVAARAGSVRFLVKPLRPQEIVAEVERAMAERVASTSRVPARGDAHATAAVFHGMVGASPAMRAMFEQIAKVGSTRQTVLIEGETGTGKEHVARALHECSGRKGRFVAVNCAAAGPDGLLESELFGHERGAYTGAIGRAAGWFEAAQAGTIFLDEIADLSLAGQAKLLRVLEQREFSRLGGREIVAVDIRVVAATNRSLERAVREGAFREDLYYRLSGCVIRAPALRERPDDVTVLVRHLLSGIAEDAGLPVPAVSEQALELLVAYQWPGNVRQLRHVLAQACLADSDLVIGADDLPQEVRADPENLLGGNAPLTDASPIQPLAESTRRHQQAEIERALRISPSVAAAARILGLSQKGLYRKRVDLGLTTKRNDPA
jgi:DNA-binding NtrC family response regulator